MNSSFDDAVNRLASQSDAVGRLAQDSGGFAAVIAAFESKDKSASHRSHQTSPATTPFKKSFALARTCAKRTRMRSKSPRGRKLVSRLSGEKSAKRRDGQEGLRTTLQMHRRGWTLSDRALTSRSELRPRDRDTLYARNLMPFEEMLGLCPHPNKAATSDWAVSASASLASTPLVPPMR
jgi:hypothetical protein